MRKYQFNDFRLFAQGHIATGVEEPLVFGAYALYSRLHWLTKASTLLKKSNERILYYQKQKHIVNL